jgi:16S rRNA (guanine966-N2)-methyltransferase
VDQTGLGMRQAGSVRIVAGSMRGRQITVAKGGVVRPTSERVREAVFDVLGPLEGLKALDLFAGTGAFGLEAVSRGAMACLFVEVDRGVAETLRGNIAALGCAGNCRVVVSDYRRAAEGLRREGKAFDLLFVDPPYRILADVEVALAPLIPSLTTSEGVVVSEGPRSQHPTFGQSLIFDRHYGDTRITMVKVRRSDS